MKDGGVRLYHVYGPYQIQSQSRKQETCFIFCATHRTTLLSSHPSCHCARGHTKLLPHLFLVMCLPWGRWKSSGKASFLGAPFHLSGLLIYHRSHFPGNVYLRASLLHLKRSSLHQGSCFAFPMASTFNTAEYSFRRMNHMKMAPSAHL